MEDKPEGGATHRADFTATHWSVVLQAGGSESPAAFAALEDLSRTYWYPLYVFVRRQGIGPAEAQDITQGFFQHVVEKRSLEHVDRGKGRFRSFLLASIKHFIMNERKRLRRLKRGGDKVILSLDEKDAEGRFQAEPSASTASPEREMDRCWAVTVMDLALGRLTEEYGEGQKAIQFRRLKRYLSTEAGDGEYQETADELDVSRSAVGVAVHRLRQRYGELIRAEVASTVAQPFEVDDEMRYLYSVLTER